MISNLNDSNYSSPLTIFKELEKIRQRSPIIHNVTNYVVMDLTANALLAIGASPIMAHAVEELPEILKLASAVVINIGTLDQEWLKSMEKTAELAKELNLPVVLDPVGVGATTYRTDAALKLLKIGGIKVVRGNSGEIMALSGEAIKSRGVDSYYQSQSQSALRAAQKLSKEHSVTVVISGSEDVIFSDEKVMTLSNGSEMMASVTGMGCTASALIGAFCAINKNSFHAATSAMAVMGISGELAERSTKRRGTGSFRVRFMDCLSMLNQKQIEGNLRLE